MKKEQQEILDHISSLLTQYPSLRFCQVLTNLNILEFSNRENPEEERFLLRDPFYDSDEKVLKRILQSNIIKQK